MEFLDGKIIESKDYEDEGNSYIIEHITAEFEEDRPEVIGILRCTKITIQSNASLQLNTEAEDKLFNGLAEEEYNDADGDGNYKEEARKDISKRTGVDISKIEIE